MKVTAGKFKGRTLIENTFEHIRPTADMVKQSIFNKLFEKISGAKVLDLFCGTGALGIEAISRGASEVVFVDKDKNSINLTLSNLKKLNLSPKVLQLDYADAIRKLEGEKFDLILIDPPYKSQLYENALKLIHQYSLLQEDGIIVCEHERGEKIDYSPFSVLDERGYGIKGVTYLTDCL